MRVTHFWPELLQIQQTFDVLTQLGLETDLEEHAELWKVVGAYVTKSNAPHALRETAAPSLLQHSVAACIRKLHSSNWFPPCTTIQVLPHFCLGHRLSSYLLMFGLLHDHRQHWPMLLHGIWQLPFVWTGTALDRAADHAPVDGAQLLVLPAILHRCCAAVFNHPRLAESALLEGMSHCREPCT